MIRSFARILVWGGLGIAPWSAPAQTLRVFSEFQRIDPFGGVVAADQPRQSGIKPREILSPAVLRNAFASFQLAVTASPGSQFTLYTGQNPDKSFRVTVYKALFARAGGLWIPDRLEPVTLPHTATAPDRSQAILHQTTAVYWMDVWVPRDTKAGRFKLEAQLWSSGRWIIYPMEVRVLSAAAGELPPPASGVAAVGLSADATAREVLRCYLCGCDSQPPAASRSVHRLIRRNALQDVALARSMEQTRGKEATSRMILERLGVPNEAEWCASPVFPEHLGAEWYLRVRDALYRTASERAPTPPTVTVSPH